MKDFTLGFTIIIKGCIANKMTPEQTAEQLNDYVHHEVKNCSILAVSNLLCGSFEPDNKTSSATKCKCGREKWEHPKAT